MNNSNQFTHAVRLIPDNLHILSYLDDVIIEYRMNGYSEESYDSSLLVNNQVLIIVDIEPDGYSKIDIKQIHLKHVDLGMMNAAQGEWLLTSSDGERMFGAEFIL